MTEAVSGEWSVPSVYGAEKTLMANIARLLQEDVRTAPRLEDILTSVSEACLNALEHGNKMEPERSVQVRFSLQANACFLRVYDEGEGIALPDAPPKTSEQWEKANPRGWGLYFIRSLADEVVCGREEERFYLEMRFSLKKEESKGESI